MRIRALNFSQMQKVNEYATDEKGNLNRLKWTVATLAEGFVIPRMTYTQAEQLIEKNGNIIQTLAEEIWRLGKISKKIFDDFLKELGESG